MSEEKELSFEEKLERATRIASALSDPSAALAESMKLYEEGRKLIDEMTGELEAAREKVRILTGEDTLEDYE
ncbi:MAG: exodeoxyribonuclease VII small subunit [Eubacteriaceae bacterium]|nr:exodeoxyribonuclease VII small subunit [Eubacteriaceae bacterium]